MFESGLQINVIFRKDLKIKTCAHTRDAITPREKFSKQLNCIKNVACKNLLIVGDFNLDYGRALCVDYANKNLLAE